MQTGAAKTGTGLAATAPKSSKKGKPAAKAGGGKQRAGSVQPAAKKPKPSAPAQAGATSVSPTTVKKGKKKKSKEPKIEIDWGIPAAADIPRCDRFLPTRALMQRLVMRAATMKEKDKDAEPACQDVRPWEKYQNRDFI